MQSLPRGSLQDRENFITLLKPCLKELHWLPVNKMLRLIDSLMAFKCIGRS